MAAIAPLVLLLAFPASGQPAPLPPALLPSVLPAGAMEPPPSAAALPVAEPVAPHAEKDVTVVLGGRAQLDISDFVLPNALRRAIPGNPLDPGWSFRRLRLDAGGTIYRHTDYLIQIDFVNAFTLGPGGPRSTDVAVPTDAWLTFKDLPVVGNVRIGNHKPPLSFEHLTSSRFLNFLERSLGFDAFAEGFNNGFEPGISAFDTYAEKRGTWTIGLFKNTRNPFAFNVGSNEMDLSGRLTYLPVYADEGRYLVHVGVGASHRDPDEGLVRFRSRFDARNSPSALAALVADTGFIIASQQHVLVPELVAVCGPLSFQSEFYASWSNGAADPTAPAVPLGTAYFWSWYAEAHLFLTGEHRVYKRETAAFDRVTPLRPVDWTRCGFSGCGAWQLAARFSHLDLNDHGFTGGRVNDLTLGVNWFLNSNVKVQWNYFLADRDAAGTAGDGTIHGFATRLAFDF